MELTQPDSINGLRAKQREIDRKIDALPMMGHPEVRPLMKEWLEVTDEIRRRENELKQL